jgi:DNA mismatch repair protein MutL
MAEILAAAPVQSVDRMKLLPPTTVRQIGATQALIDPSSVVKELIDNALDARATAIFVNITANTISSIEVKDNGHGIPQEDRPLVCRRSYTSKIRSFDELKEMGSIYLGFRGEAMASLAEISGALSVTTRVEGDQTAEILKFGRNGEMTSYVELHPSRKLH